MSISRGKQFERVIRNCLEKIPRTSVDRIYDQTNGFKGSSNICDFIAYRYPNQFYFECKTVHGNVLPFSNISDNQWKGMLEKSDIGGVRAGVICWWVDKDVTKFLDIRLLSLLKDWGRKSVRYDVTQPALIKEIRGKKKRIFFDYDMKEFLDGISYYRRY